jgi:hypothetical protein
MARSTRQAARFEHADGQRAFGSDQLTLHTLDGERKPRASVGPEGPDKRG